MTSEDCVRCGMRHVSDSGGWRYRKWETESGYIMGWGCLELGEKIQYEWVPNHVKEERKQYAVDMIQSHRQGKLSREFVEMYPDKVKGMIKEGVVTKGEVKKSEYVWKEREFKNWEKKRKTDRVSDVVESPKAV